ncbi:MAG: hypothetical protein IPO40_05070 [Fibrobacteres bacterium]|nr:hypothetical protein [Fibrobacterota bacterium]
MHRSVRISMLAPALLGLAIPVWSAHRFQGPAPRTETFTLRNQTFAARASSAGVLAGPDTLEVHAFLVDFSKEVSPNDKTTGNGTFGSDSSTATHLESWRARRDSTREHYLRVFQGVSSYWRDASGGRLSVQFRVFPESNSAQPYHLPRFMGQYSPELPSDPNQYKYFDSLYATRYVEMASDAIRAAAKDPAGPFSVPLASRKSRQRAYMMIHAGANADFDGGEKGGGAANTPQDLRDYALGPWDFNVLSYRRTIADTSYLKDSSGVGIRLPGADTVRNLLVMAETATQDGSVFGVRGSATYLVGRALGLPDLWDASKGLAVAGKFCLMDAAGTNLGNGFLPPLPSAWPRLYMGWATPVFASAQGPSTFKLDAVRPGKDTVLVVSIAEGEYLLVENRQRTESDNKARFRTGRLDGLDSVEQALPPDSILTVLKDAKRSRGYLYGASPDAMLPGSGLLVWHVNEWLLRETLRWGAPNAWLGDTLRDRYRAITLVQASGKPSLGQAFQSVAGAISDLGSGSDMLPHARRTNGRVDTIRAIGPEGWTSTGALLGARSLTTLTATWPSDAKPQPGVTTLERDSVWTPGATSLQVKLGFGPYRLNDASFPVRLPPVWGGSNFLPGPSALPRSLWVVDTSGAPQLLDSTGTPWFASKDTLKLVWPYDSTPSAFATRPSLDTLRMAWPKIAHQSGRPVATATRADLLAIRLADGTTTLLAPTTDAFDPARRDSARFFLDKVLDGATAGPIVVTDGFWMAKSDTILSVSRSGPGAKNATGLSTIGSLCAIGPGSQAKVGAVDAAGQVAALLPSGSLEKWTNSGMAREPGETFQILSTDFDRDGNPDVAVLGSHGNASILSGATRAPMSGWPKRFPRTTAGMGEPSPGALGDMDGDGRPELLFAGANRVWAVDGSGTLLPGWPADLARTEAVAQVTASRRYPAGLVGASPLVADLDGNGSNEIVISGVDGQARVFSGNGASWTGPVLGATPGAAAGPTYAQGSWPLAVASPTFDTLRPPFVPLALLGTGKDVRLVAVSSRSTLDEFRLGQAKSKWAWTLGDPGRSSYLPDSLLGTVRPRPDGISEFHLFPSPVRDGRATFRYVLGKDARSVTLSVWEQTGARAFQRSDLPSVAGRREIAFTDLPWGSGVYAARLEVKWASGGQDEAWFRFGVVR